MNPETWIPLVATAIIGIATLAVIPIIKALGELKKQTEEIHKVVNSNFTAQKAELDRANEKIEVLVRSTSEANQRVSDLLLSLQPTHQSSNPSNTVQTIPVTVVNPEPVRVTETKK